MPSLTELKQDRQQFIERLERGGLPPEDQRIFERTLATINARIEALEREQQAAETTTEEWPYHPAENAFSAEANQPAQPAENRLSRSFQRAERPRVQHPERVAEPAQPVADQRTVEWTQPAARVPVEVPPPLTAHPRRVEVSWDNLDEVEKYRKRVYQRWQKAHDPEGNPDTVAANRRRVAEDIRWFRRHGCTVSVRADGRLSIHYPELKAAQ